MRENFEIFDFELDTEHVSALDELDRGEAGRTGPEPGLVRLHPLIRRRAASGRPRSAGHSASHAAQASKE